MIAFHRANTVLTPIMASRLMLSLKKASVEPSGPWHLSTISNFGSKSREGETLHFASRMLNAPHEIPETLDRLPSNEGDVELNPVFSPSLHK